MLVSELLHENILLEKLGNLHSLNVGSMINILKQSIRDSGRNNRNSYNISPAGKKFTGGGYGHGFNDTGGFGDNSEIIDVGVIKGGIRGLRKAYKAHKDAIAFALYVDKKAVCFGRYTEDKLAGSSRTGIFAYDLTQFKDQLEKQAEEKKKTAPSWNKDNITPRDTSPYKEKELSDWEKRNAEKAGKKISKNIFYGEARDTASLKVFIEELIELAGDKPITCKLVLKDEIAFKKLQKRYSIAMSKSQLKDGLEDLKIRLAKYKISKKPTADTIESFLEQALKSAGKVLQFGGRGYSTTPDSGYGDINSVKILSGQPFSIHYRTVDPGSHDIIEVFYSFDKESNTLKPFKVKWTDKESRATEIAALEPEKFIKHELGVTKVDKDEILKKILIKLKDGNTYDVKNLIAAARKGGHDYPEFKAIEKSLAASEKKD